MRTSNDAVLGLDWVRSSCTLPTAEQPFRVVEFDDLFAIAVRAVDRLSPTTLRLTVDANAAARATELADRESSCCSFFGFEFAPAATQAAAQGAGDTVAIQVTVPAAHTAVLDAFAARAATRADTAALAIRPER
ncbi:hypothetical protein ACIBG5_38675 [Kribbella sp. NPDC050241]|uniref:hypothetical protein n=1 Tax=Kribbella sp. NPDC050241 TaxID=3364115 RepID=UPI003793B5BC